MAWQDVPAKLTQYAALTYAPDNADVTLLSEYGVTDVSDVPAHRREDFEADLDYRLGACQNLEISRAVRP